MNPNMQIWVYRLAVFVAGVLTAAVAGIKPDAAHFGAWAMLVGLVQGIVLSALGELIRRWGGP